jgi:hypothetical protein
MSSAIVRAGYLDLAPRRIVLMAAGTCQNVRVSVGARFPADPVSGLYDDSPGS